MRYNPLEMQWQHLGQDDLEKYYLGLIAAESQLAPLEEHLLSCPACVAGAQEAGERVETIRAAIIRGDFDLLV